MPPKLVPTGVAADRLGISRNTLHRWWVEGYVKPAYVTPGGHARWDFEDLQRQLSEQRQQPES